MQEYKIVCIEGELKGAEIILGAHDCITIGRDPATANLVFRDITISRKHCVIETKGTDKYFVTAFSSCGIVTGAGSELKKGGETEVPRGTILQIGKSGTEIRLE